MERMQPIIGLIQVFGASGSVQSSQETPQLGRVLGSDTPCRSCREKLLKTLVAETSYHL
jgi:hypothetical protein